MTPIIGVIDSQKSGHLWAPSQAYQSIASTTLGTTSNTITFTGIPQNYSHLQLRMLARASGAYTNADILFTLNGDSGSNYSYHWMYGDGTTPANGGGATSTTAGRFARNSLIANSGTASVYSSFVIDLYDYTNVNKYKTTRSLGGYDANGSGTTGLVSSNWRSFAPVTSLSLTTDGTGFALYSSFALYGVL